MKKFIRAARAALLLGISAALFAVAPASAAPLVATGVNDFSISSFSADYYLDIDDEGRSTLRTVEVIVAQFPNYPQNHGIVRHLVEDYQDQSTNLRVTSVQDEDGNSRNYETESSNGFLSLQIGDADKYLLGAHTFVISYTQHNVTLFDGNVEELYWDTNGTGWPQAFLEVVARFHVSDELVGQLNGDSRCYQGRQGSGTECAAPLVTEEPGGLVYEISGSNLFAFENLTIAIGFKEGTFQPRDNSALASPFFFPLLAFTALAAVGAGIALFRRTTVFADELGRPTIVAEYLPPKDVKVLVAAAVTKNMSRAVAAQLVAMAVNHNIRIIETEGTGFLSKSPQYTIELLDPTGLEGEVRQLAEAFFGAGLIPGSTYAMKKQDPVLGQRVFKILAAVRRSLVARDLLKKVPSSARLLPVLLVFGGGAGAMFCMIAMLDDQRGGFIPVGVFAVAAIATVIVLSVIGRKPLTARGAELRDYLKGLLLYIKVAETDRIRILQSPQGAERTPVNTADRGEMLKLYERVLPYAILFNEEKQWSQVLGNYYDQEPPSWYSGSAGFTTAAFVTGISALSSSVASSSSASSSSSGSSGGGSSGGGGGGGGGGGW